MRQMQHSVKKYLGVDLLTTLAVVVDVGRLSAGLVRWNPVDLHPDKGVNYGLGFILVQFGELLC